MNINLSSVPKFRAGAYGAMVADDGGEFVKVADLEANIETHSLQCWPSGHSYTYRGDIHAPTIEVRIDGLWRTATEEEHGQIKINVLANIYADRDVLCCDSSLVSDLIEAGGELPRDMSREFDYDQLRNVYADPSNWDAAECKAYADEHDLELPDLEPCAEHEEHHDECEACRETCEDEGRHGWLTAARDVCREYARDNPAEVYEWWRVSSWLCAALDSIGEVTIDNGYGYWWGRCCTGQGFIMDGVLQRVAAR
jgi:hypothetical protein